LDVGLYGFSKGKATFGFKEDGTAFIGESGAGRIDFNGETGTIQSGSWKRINDNSDWQLDSLAGTLFDLDDGKLIFKRKIKNKSYEIILDSTVDNLISYPLSIGMEDTKNFKVKWDGSIEVKGDIKAGTIGNGWIIDEDEIYAYNQEEEYEIILSSNRYDYPL
jgi:hypothetical protein